MTYEKKVASAIKLLQSIPQDGPIELAYSGGKDSDVILELAKMAGIPFRPIYKNTTIDPPGTIQHVKDMGVAIRQPKLTMLQIIETKGWPTRRARFCCSVLKEYKIWDRCIVGVRRAESTARAKRYHEPELCRIYNKNERVRQYLPILEWTDEDVEKFIKERGIHCAPIYYDRGGQFHVERRLGCIGCPLKSDNGRGDFKKYPKMLKAWIKAEKKYLDTHPNSRAKEKFGTAYDMAFHDLFTKSYDDYIGKVHGLLPDADIDPKKYLEEYFGIDLTL